MPARSRRPDLLARYIRILDRNYPDQAISYAVAQELIQAAEGLGIDVDRLAVIEDPVVTDWRDRDRPVGAAPDLTGVRQRITEAQRRFGAADQAAMDDEDPE